MSLLAAKRERIFYALLPVLHSKQYPRASAIRLYLSGATSCDQGGFEVYPFRVNSHVAENLIDWSNIPDDPMFRLTFPQAGMLSADDYTMLECRSLDHPRGSEEDSASAESESRGPDGAEHSMAR